VPRAIVALRYLELLSPHRAALPPFIDHQPYPRNDSPLHRTRASDASWAVAYVSLGANLEQRRARCAEAPATYRSKMTTDKPCWGVEHQLIITLFLIKRERGQFPHVRPPVAPR
jgi:hypothetical protein